MEAFVVGSGPNGLTAAITLARAGLQVTVLEAECTIGGGARSAELTLPGFVHDICSAVHPMAASSPAFASMPLAAHGLHWVQPPIPVAHPLPHGQAAVARISIDATASGLGADAETYRELVSPLVARWRDLIQDILAPIHMPAHPLLLARFGILAPWSASFVAHRLFNGEPARALFAGMAAHSMLPLDRAGSAAFGWVLLLSSHAVGWPIARGGSQAIADALTSYLRSLGGVVLAGRRVQSLRSFPPHALVLCDVTPRQLLALADGLFPRSYTRKLASFTYGPGVFKLDWALAQPIPWTNPECRQAGTLHLGGSIDEIAASEQAVGYGKICPHPFVLLSQPTLFDPSRAPSGKHTAWAYCHVPNGSTADMTGYIEAQVERFAPGFLDVVLARRAMSSADLEAHNANLVGGDIGGGAATLDQLFFGPRPACIARPSETYIFARLRRRPVRAFTE